MPIPPRSFPRSRSRAAVSWLFAALVALAATGCTERGDPVAVPEPAPKAPREPVLDAVACHAVVATGEVRCERPSPPGGAANASIIVGGQGSFVKVSTKNVAYDGGAGRFTFDLTLQSLIPQPIGTADGTTPDPDGVRIFFASEPVVLQGFGRVTVAGDGSAAFTSGGQPYYQYSGSALGPDGILSRYEVAVPRSWGLDVPPTVYSFGFLLYVAGEVPRPEGYVEIVPPRSGGVESGDSPPSDDGWSRADTMLAGATALLAATVRSAAGTPQPGESVSWSTSDAAVATVDAAGRLTAVAPGRATLTATSGARTGTLELRVCPDLVVGGVYLSTGPELCIGTGAAATEYTVTPVNLGSASAAFSATGSGIVPVAGAPSPLRASPPPAARAPRHLLRDDEFHQRQMQARARMEAQLRSRPPVSHRSRRNIVPGVPAVGAVMNLNMSTGELCSDVEVRPATVKAVGAHVLVMEDGSNPPGGFTDAEYAELVKEFDELVYPTVTGSFGTPGDIDANGRMIALFTRAVNALTLKGSIRATIGFFDRRDLLSAAACAASNEGEMMYMMVPDPGGVVNGNSFSAAEVKERTVATFGHELQHLVNASRRLGAGGADIPFEEIWLNEGLSHIAEEELYFAVSRHSPGENLAWATIDDTEHPEQREAFGRFAKDNFDRLADWMVFPDVTGPFAATGKAIDIANRGAVWSFLRYAADRKGGTRTALWSALAGGPETGLANLEARLGTDPLPWFRDWAVSIYLDDAVSGVPASFCQPTWNLRSILGPDGVGGAGAAYPLMVRKPADGVAETFSILGGGGAAYVRMGVPANGFAGLRTTAPSPTLAVAIARTK